MVTKVKQVFKNQKGFTLIELLAVVVILGIISAIAVPSIGGLIDNTKKDAHIANAQQMISSAKLAVTSDKNLQPTDTEPTVYLSLAYLENEGYLEEMKDPDGENYTKGDAKSVKGTHPTGSYVEITKSGKNQFIYKVKLDNGTRTIGTYDQPVLANEIDREDVIKKEE